jgi:hypothetical protein
MKQVVVGGVNIQLQGDLLDMQKTARLNGGFRYILLLIDCFSRFCYARPLKRKQGELTAEATSSILDEAEKRIARKVTHFQVDQGTEFYNTAVKKVMEKRFINMFSTKSPTKAQMVERLIRTLRARQERLNSNTGTRRWLESFPKLVTSYNNTIHSSLPPLMTPAKVSLSNEGTVWKHLYGGLLKTPASLKKKLVSLAKGKGIPLNTQKGKLRVGDLVRISKIKGTFEKSYYPNWSEEIFFISHASNLTSPHSFRLIDSKGEPVEGIFYKHELSQISFDVKDPKGTLFAVEKVVKSKIGPDGKKLLLVKWAGYSEEHNEWVRADQFHGVNKAL